MVYEVERYRAGEGGREKGRMRKEREKKKREGGGGGKDSVL